MYLAAGATGLFANCLSSEMFELTPEERIAITKHVVTVTNKQVPVVATGSFGGSIPEQADFIKKIYETGIEAVIITTSMIAGEEETDGVFDERVFELLRQTEGIPLGFYECPDPYKRLLSVSQLRQFVATGRIVYHKDTSLDIEEIKARLQATAGYQFGLYDAYIVHAVESLRSGAAGLSCIQGNYLPELIVWICDNYNKEALQTEVDEVLQFFTENMDVMHQVYPTVSKYFLSKRGLDISSVTRRNVGPFSTEVQHEIDLLYSKLERLCTRLELNVTGMRG